MKNFFILMTILCSPLLLATPADEAQRNFKPDQFNHSNIGCPMNSACSKENGKNYQIWSKTLRKTRKQRNQSRALNRMANKHGYPFSHWISAKGSDNPLFIVWDSHCRNHNIEGQDKIHIGLQFIKNISELKALQKKGLIHTRFIHILESSGRVSKRMAPRIDTPLYLNGDNLVYQIEFEGNYFSQSLASDGNLNIIPNKTPKEFPETIECPKALLATVDKDSQPKNLYRGFFCQRTWDIQTKQLKTLLFPWGCN